uniref:Exonuclease 1 n=1 Tax=Cacopsylla melanoneura TaxID=428564 RepID=A0A8D8TN02_9HEMI
MGITNLLQILKDASVQKKVSELKGSTVAVDAYGWLHKGIFSCADKLARGEDCDMYVKYCMKYVNMLLAFNIKIVMVFDGRHLPAKEATEEDRRKKRNSHKAKAAELLILDRGNEAHSHLRQSVDVTHKMASNLIKACRSAGVDSIVAPFEADAQLAYLNMAGYVDYVITEDSDLLVFGAKKTVYKLDLAGTCCIIDRERIPAALRVPEKKYSDAKFRYMCILSGSDYWTGLKGIGLKKAKDFVWSVQDPDYENDLRNTVMFRRAAAADPEFINTFNCTNLMFLYQPVYDPQKREVVTLNHLEPDKVDPILSQLSLKELKLPDEQAYQLALGNLDPFTLEEVDNWDPDDGQNDHPDISSIWSKSYLPPEARRKVTESKSDGPINVFQRLTPVVKSSPRKMSSSLQTNSPVKSRRSIPDTPEKLAGKRKSEDNDLLQQYARPNISRISFDVKEENPDTPPPSPPSKMTKSQYAFGVAKSQNPLQMAKSQNASVKTPQSQNVIVQDQTPDVQKTPRSQNPFAISKTPQSQNLIVQTPIVQKTPRSQNPFAISKSPQSQISPAGAGSIVKSPDTPKSPDLSNRSLKSGLKQILDSGAQKKVVAQRIISPFFAKFTLEASTRPPVITSQGGVRGLIPITKVESRSENCKETTSAS